MREDDCDASSHAGIPKLTRGNTRGVVEHEVTQTKRRGLYRGGWNDDVMAVANADDATSLARAGSGWLGEGADGIARSGRLGLVRGGGGSAAVACWGGSE